MKFHLYILIIFSYLIAQVDSNVTKVFPDSFSFKKKGHTFKKNQSLFSIGDYKDSQLKIGKYLGYNNLPHQHYNQYFKIGDGLVIHSNFEKFMYSNNSKYSDIYGKDLINRVNGPYNSGLRYFPLGNNFLNIDARTYNDVNGISEGQSLGIGIWGMTIFKFYKNGKVN